MKGAHPSNECTMITPDEILENAPKMPRVIKVEANVIAYFGDMFHALRQSIHKKISEDPVRSARIVPSNTASSHNQS
jgi:hypothetical protein